MRQYTFHCSLIANVPELWQQRMNEAQKYFLESQKNVAYSDGYSFINVSFDKKIIASVISLASEKKLLRPRMLIVIGIGGSNLGAKAVHEFLHGIYYNDMQPAMSCYFVDTLQVDALHSVLHLMERQLIEGHEVIISVISKSGTTTETIINFDLFLSLLKKYRPDTYQNFIIVTTDEGSKFAALALKEHFSLLTIPPVIGGRYSVFTAVGLFPLAMLGIDIEQLCKGAGQIVADVLSDSNNDPIQGAYISYDQCLQGKNIHDMFVFGSELTSFALWYRQLVGESLGKDKEKGITPTVSVGSTDLHSVGQLYLGGPRDKYVTFVSTDQQRELFFDQQSELKLLLPLSKKNNVHCVMQAIIEGTKKAYKLDDRPFESLHLAKDAYSCGQVLQFCMMRIVYMAHLLQVNPFDQPHVELYKRQVREILRYE